MSLASYRCYTPHLSTGYSLLTSTAQHDRRDSNPDFRSMGASGLYSPTCLRPFWLAAYTPSLSPFRTVVRAADVKRVLLAAAPSIARSTGLRAPPSSSRQQISKPTMSKTRLLRRTGGLRNIAGNRERAAILKSCVMYLCCWGSGAKCWNLWFRFLRLSAPDNTGA